VYYYCAIKYNNKSFEHHTKISGNRWYVGGGRGKVELKKINPFHKKALFY
jgi:hypothetical protein